VFLMEQLSRGITVFGRRLFVLAALGNFKQKSLRGGLSFRAGPEPPVRRVAEVAQRPEPL